MHKILFSTAIAAALVFSHTADAGVTLYEQDALTIDGGLRADAAYLQTRNTNFGAGAFGENNTNVAWFEAFVKPSLTFEYRGVASGSVYGGTSVVAAMTRGNGDPTGLTQDGPEDIDLDALYTGRRSGDAGIATIGGQALKADFSVGRQFYMAGDGFLIGDPHFDQGKEAALWLSPRDSFKFTAISKLALGKWRGDFFWIEADRDQAKAKFYGTNMEFDVLENFVVGGLFMNIVEAGDWFNAGNPDSREGLKTASVRAQGNPVASVPDLFLSSEYAHQWNDSSTRDVQAQAYYGEVGYSFPETPWTPSVFYRFTSFSGNDVNSSQDETFDPLFFGYSRGWGTWFMGEVVGEWLIFNSNVRSHMVKATVNPHEKLGLGAIYYQFWRNEPASTTSNAGRYADEIDVYAEFYATKNLTLTAYYARAFPGSAAKSEFNSDDDYQVFFLAAGLNF